MKSYRVANVFAWAAVSSIIFALSCHMSSNRASVILSELISSECDIPLYNISLYIEHKVVAQRLYCHNKMIYSIGDIPHNIPGVVTHDTVDVSDA